MPLIFLKTRVVPDGDLELRAVRSSGPGGQNVNKLATKVQLRFFIDRTETLSNDEKERLRRKYPGRLSGDGSLLVSCDEARSYETNKRKAFAKLRACLEEACRQEVPRIKTRPSRKAKQRRLDDKKARARLKSLRSERWN